MSITHLGGKIRENGVKSEKRGCFKWLWYFKNRHASRGSTDTVLAVVLRSEAVSERLSGVSEIRSHVSVWVTFIELRKTRGLRDQLG